MKNKLCVTISLVLFFLFLLAFPHVLYSDTSSSTNPLLDDLEQSLQKVETMLQNTVLDLERLKIELTRVSGLLIEARKLSGEQLELYERLLKRYENVVESYLILDRLYKGARRTIWIEGGVIAALAAGLAVSLIIK